MKHPFAFALAGLLTCTSLMAQAQDGHPPHDNGHGGPAPSHARRDHGSFHDNGHEVNYRPGQQLPPQFRGHDHYVDNYRDYHLSAPPRGHRWVRDDNGDFVLVAVATGVITSILAGH